MSDEKKRAADFGVRLVTALALACVVFFLIFKLTNEQIACVSSAFLALAAWESSGFLGWKTKRMRVGYVGLTLLSFFLVNYLSVNLVLSIGVIWWFVALMMLVLHAVMMPILVQNNLVMNVFRPLIGLLTLVPAWVGLITIHAVSPWYLVLVLLLVSAFDIGAYLAGSFWGKTKLMPAISPGKSWEGLLGGSVFSLFVVLFGLLFFPEMSEHAVAFLGLSVVVVIFAVVGDLFESMQKRMVGIKNSGSLLPGHGGLLDRMDSLTSTLPVFALAMVFLDL